MAVTFNELEKPQKEESYETQDSDKMAFLQNCYHLKTQKNVCAYYNISNAEFNAIVENHFPELRAFRGCKGLKARVEELFPLATKSNPKPRVEEFLERSQTHRAHILKVFPKPSTKEEYDHNEI